jgi:hypothetical protein
LRLTTLIGVFDDDAEPFLALVVRDLAKDPNARPVHLHDHVGAFRRGQEQNVDGARRRHAIAVKRDDGETMARQRQSDILGRAGVEQPEQHALARPHAHGFAVPEHPVVEGRRCIHHFEAVVGGRTWTDILHAHP